ncbi:hydroxymethylglutaryl-CoA synthase [Eupransor demetentiae]|uniref:3-hydroxy-3-methylglutaryl CoA synthase (PksG) n=1 Tax=Eupransor demetentiae TaxID=3109584 RepID=A0ABM9N3T7_9LACO|nr:3-hydroxy-3-methylglutaryl CoA synthase (PksG) [Lactobacillaceae bacterium LMG 33000]
MEVGIDKIAFYTPKYYLDLVELAQARDVDPNKFTIGIGQDQQAVIPNYEDAVTMGVNAANQILTDDNRQSIGQLYFGTESGVDNSKSAAIFAAKLLNLSPYIRAMEVKEACYGGTFALMMARDYVKLHPDQKVLVLAADVARYGLDTPGEVTQGGGGIAMLVSAQPKLAVIEDESVFASRDVADFWRPVDRMAALVDGHLSTEIYKEMFADLWQRYQKQTQAEIGNFAAFAFHLPYTKMGKKALDEIIDQADEQQAERLLEALKASQAYARRVGNLYTGSLYLSLLSLLQQDAALQAGDRLALFSYGSGAEAELFTLKLQKDFKQIIAQQKVEEALDARQRLSVAEYEADFQKQLYDSSQNVESDYPKDSQDAVFTGWRDGQRIYRA